MTDLIGKYWAMKLSEDLNLEENVPEFDSSDDKISIEYDGERSISGLIKKYQFENQTVHSWKYTSPFGNGIFQIRNDSNWIVIKSDSKDSDDNKIIPKISEALSHETVEFYDRLTPTRILWSILDSDFDFKGYLEFSNGIRKSIETMREEEKGRGVIVGAQLHLWEENDVDEASTIVDYDSGELVLYSELEEAQEKIIQILENTLS